MDSKRITTGIYIHIPFCIRKCAYCDFLSAPAVQSVQEAYMRAIQTEITVTAKRLRQQGTETAVRTVFIGGGTPTAVNAESIAEVLTTLRSVFSMSETAEITMECNPGTLDEEKARIYREAGINRLSFGLQSADNTELKLLGRIHTLEQFQESYTLARQAGFSNINIDLMSALPGQTFESFRHTLDTVLSLAPEHISVYSLILEEGTRLYAHLDEYPPLPDEDTERKMYDDACMQLAKAGYRQYEISNFAKEGMACRHNLSYWERKNYLGFGIGAASLFEECRYTNTDDITEYMQIMASAGNLSADKVLCAVRTEETQLSVNAQMEEYLFLGLRKNDGISEEAFARQFGRKIDAVYADVLQKNIELGLLVRQDGSIFLTNRGREVSNVVMADFLLD